MFPTKGQIPEFQLCMASGAVTKAAILSVLLNVNIHWQMHPAQLFSLEIQTVDWSQSPVTVEQCIADEEDKLVCEIIPATKYTLCGLPIEINEGVPESWIRLMQGNKEIARIDSLAVPCAFSGWKDFDSHNRIEQEKARILNEDQKKFH